MDNLKQLEAPLTQRLRLGVELEGCNDSEFPYELEALATSEMTCPLLTTNETFASVDCHKD